MSPTTSQGEFSRPFLAASLSPDGRRFRIEADAAERERLARRLDLVSVDRLEADLVAFSSDSDTNVRLKGKFIADVVQTCVVTLEPVKAHIEADLERIYSVEEKVDDAAEAEFTPDDAEPTESLIDGAFDAGEAVTEQLALELDPFPRSPNAEFAGYTTGDNAKAGDQASPFGVLAKLKRDLE